MKKIILILIVIAAVAGGCIKSKYEKTIEKICGDYTLKTYTVNGIDSLSLYKDSLGTDFNLYYFDDVDCFYVLRISGIRKDGEFCMLDCRWRLTQDNKIFNIYKAYGQYGTGPFGGNKISEWKILNLGAEFKMITAYKGKVYLIELALPFSN